MSRWLAVAALLGGCDVIWRLDHFDHGDGDGGVIPGDDAPLPDAAACPSSTHDEDSDHIYDLCDTCPTVFNLIQADDDGDGIGNQCDPNAGVLPQSDLVELYLPFTDLNGITPAGLVSGDGDNAVMAGNSSVTTTQLTKADELDILFSADQITGSPTLAIDFVPIQCRIVDTKCLNDMGNSCLYAGLISQPVNVRLGQIRGLRMSRVSGTMFACSVLYGGNNVVTTPPSSGVMDSGAAIISVSTARVTLHSLVVYSR